MAEPACPPPAFALPARRRGVRYAPRLGACCVYVTSNRVSASDDRIAEVWIDVEHKEGSVLVGVGHALARLASLALQAGTPIGTVVHALLGVTGGPAEVTDCDGIDRAESVPDLVAQVLALAAGACPICGEPATIRGAIESDEEADAADPMCLQPVGKRRVIRCAEHGAALHEPETLLTIAGIQS